MATHHDTWQPRVNRLFFQFAWSVAEMHASGEEGSLRFFFGVIGRRPTLSGGARCILPTASLAGWDYLDSTQSHRFEELEPADQKHLESSYW
jgi:hypothetical protein